MKKPKPWFGLALLILAAIAAFTLFSTSRSTDLMATWIAGHYYATGDLGQIYPLDRSEFTMRPPPKWAQYVQGTSRAGELIFPFLYPPIWAWAGALFADIPFATIAPVATALNAAMLSGTIWLAYRTLNTQMPLTQFALIGLMALYATPIATLAIYDAQPQILVCFLIVLALERTRASAPIPAGAALALAASIKLYPAIFALFWLASNENRATLSFAVFGGALAVASVIMTGWPLHADFLATIGAMNNSVLISDLNFSVHAALVPFAAPESRIVVTAPTALPGAEPKVLWKIVVKTPLWQMFSVILPFLVAAALFVGFRRADDDRRYRALWPTALVFVPMTSPIAWPYYFISAVVFIPALFRKELRGHMVLALILIASLTFPAQALYHGITSTPTPMQLAGLIAIGMLGILFFTNQRRG
jgi:hypothetical protein